VAGDNQDELEIVPEQAWSPAPNPGSPATSKSDSEGILPYLSALAVEFTVCLPPPAGSDGEMEQGDVDEGFDEEFEDKDLNEPEPSNNFQFEDLDPKELQQLLDDPQLPNLEDFDLGVDVLDSEQAHPILSPSMRNSGSYSPVASSPYQNIISPATPIDSYYNSHNLDLSDSFEDPPSVQSNISALSMHAEDLPLSMLVATGCDMVPDSTTTGLSGPDTSTSPSGLPPQHPGPGGLDLSEASQLLSADMLIELSTALSSEASLDTESMYMFGNGSASLSLNQQNTSSSVITLLDSATMDSTTMFPVMSQSMARITPTLPNPLHPSYETPVSPRQSRNRSISLSPAPSTESKISEEDQKLIDMPYYQFRKLLDDQSISDTRKEEIKSVRRKGRNKVAAKACRTKKLSLIMGLEQEVEQLRKAKSQIAIKTISLEREIAELKKRCHNR
jgi:hypothetical protein